MIRELCRLLPENKQQLIRQLIGSTKQALGFRRGQELTAAGAISKAAKSAGAEACPQAKPNPFAEYFDSVKDGHGIWKWRHYFEIYQRHFEKFIGKEVNVLEIGIYSGGSLGMWQACFGASCRVFGVDIEPACRAYESERVRIFIGDQADRNFWKTLRDQTPPMDIVIDDGGHLAHQQIVTLEETLVHLKPGGVYLCEDVHGVAQEFIQYVNGFAINLNAFRDMVSNGDNPERQSVVTATPFQSAIHSVHLYPFCVVIERNPSAVPELIAPRHGTQWQPFLNDALNLQKAPG